MITNPDHLSESFIKKSQFANNLCRQKMTPSQQDSEHEQLIVKTKNQCLVAYHPEDTDVSAAKIRDMVCNCFANVTTDGKSSREALNSCEKDVFQRLAVLIHEG
jgi:hypothetical protein